MAVHRWGYDAASGCNCWEVDNSGVSKVLEYDDHESILLAAWARSGAWLLPHLQERLTVQVSARYRQCFY